MPTPQRAVTKSDLAHNGRIEDLLPRAQLCVAESWEEIEEFPARISHFLNDLL